MYTYYGRFVVTKSKICGQGRRVKINWMEKSLFCNFDAAVEADAVMKPPQMHCI